MTEWLECPCCKGQGYLRIYDPEWPDAAPIFITPCCHCAGTGKISNDGRGPETREEQTNDKAN